MLPVSGDPYPSSGSSDSALRGVPRPRGPHVVARYVTGILLVVVVAIVIVAGVAPRFAPPPTPYVAFSASWMAAGCTANATFSVPLNYTGRFTNINGPDAYAVVGVYVNDLLRNVSTYYVPTGTWDMAISGSLPVSCATFRNADVAVISTLPA